MTETKPKRKYIKKAKKDMPIKEPKKEIKIFSDKNKQNIWENYDFKDLINIKNFLIDNLYQGIKVSTVCASCNIGTNLNIDNLVNYFPLDTDSVLTVKKTQDDLRTLLTQVIKNTDDNKKIKSFQNSVTIVMRKTSGFTEDLDNEPKINMKIFNNGSIQLSGCKDLEAVNIVFNKFIFMLKQNYVFKGTDEQIIFVEDKSKLKISGFKIDMINANYIVDMVLKRERLFELLTLKKIKTSYEPCTRACVIIKIVPEGSINKKELSIFVFEKGNIIITGAKNKHQLKYAYDFINELLVTHQSEINKQVDLIDIINDTKYKKLIDNSKPI